MISIIICTRSAEISIDLKNNIYNTIGVTYEIIIINNSNNEYSIFSAYNEGVRRSQFDILCFMHDDLFFETMYWGESVVERFKLSDIGAIGVAGTPYLSILPGAWWSGGYICQHISGQKDLFYKPVNNNALPVVAVDGLWFCIPKSLFKQIRFDDIVFTGFHYYDIDICLQIRKLGLTILSVYDITISHSSGTLDPVWLKNALLFQKKWNKLLPHCTEILPYSLKVRIEYAVLEEYMQAMRKNGIQTSKIFFLGLTQIIKHRVLRFKITFPFFFIKYLLRYFNK